MLSRSFAFVFAAAALAFFGGMLVLCGGCKSEQTQKAALARLDSLINAAFESDSTATANILLRQKLELLAMPNTVRTDNERATERARCWYGLAMNEDRADSANAYLDRATTLAETAARTPNAATVLAKAYAYKGYYAKRRGDIPTATTYYERAAAHYIFLEQLTKNTPDVARKALDYVENVAKPLGNCYTRLGDYPNAERVQTDALRRALQEQTTATENTENTDRIASLYGNLAILYANEERRDTAAATARRGSTIKGISPIRHAALLAIEADARHDTALLATAIAALERAKGNPNDHNWQRNNEWLGGACLTYAALLTPYHSNEKHTSAHTFLTPAHTFATRAVAYYEAANGKNGGREMAKAYIALGRGEPNTEKAVSCANTALRCVIPAFQPATPAENPADSTFYAENSIIEALELKADALAAGGNAVAAAQTYRAALGAARPLRLYYLYTSSKEALTANLRGIAQKAIAALWETYAKKPNDTLAEAAFEIAEQSKALALLDAVVENDPHNDPHDPTQAKIAATRDIRRKLAFYQDQITQNKASASAKHAYLALQNELAALHASLPSGIVAANTPTAALTAVHIAPNTEIIEYFAAPNALYGFALRAANGGQPQVRFVKLRNDALPTFDNKNLDADAAFRAYAALFAPLSDTTTRRTVVIPDGALFALPFDALLTQPVSAAAALYPRNLPFLVKTREVSYGYSLRIWSVQQRAAAAATRLGYALPYLGIAPFVGNAAVARSGFAVLPFSGEEVQNGCGILGGETLIGRAATARAVLGRAASARIVHFATHAAALPDGSLRLEAADTSVSLPEIEQLHLAADLVMLSACETARGNYMAGEGVASLARGFTVAGAHGLTANLWSVSDRASGKLLAAFFTHLKEGKRKPEALRLAKLDYLAETSTNAAALPYFWASMVYFGNESPLEATLAPNSSPPHLARIFWATLTVIWLLTMLICGYFYARFAAK